MKVAEYRDLIGELAQWCASLASVATESERVAEMGQVRRAVEALKAAVCQRATVEDRWRAERWVCYAEKLLDAGCVME